MRRVLLVFQLAILLLSCSSLQAQINKINILFVGNSFTARHNLHLLVEELVHEGKPTWEIYTERVIYGGQSLFQHTEYYHSHTFIEQSTITDSAINARIAVMDTLLNVSELPAEYIHFWDNVRQKPVRDWPVDNINTAIERHESLLLNNPRKQWDYVVLQSWDDLTVDSTDGYAKYAKQLGEIARRQGAKVVFYMTAPDFQNQLPVTEPLNQAQFESDMDIMIRLTREFNPFAIIPVPLAINNIQQGGTSLTFRYVNDFHPNQRTAFLTSNMIYAALFDESTEGFHFNTVTETLIVDPLKPDLDPDGGSLTLVFDESEKLYLQQMAYNAVIEFKNLIAVGGVLQELLISTESGATSISQNQGTLQMTVEPVPISVGTPAVTWSLENANDIATITGNGLLSALGNKNGFVTVIATSNENPLITASFTVLITGQSGVTDTEINEISRFKPYPSPFSDYLILENFDDLQYEVFRAPGVLVYKSGRSFENIIDTKKWTKGVYWIRCENGQTHILVKS